MGWVVDINTGMALYRIRGDRIVDINTGQALYRIKDMETRDLTSRRLDP